MDIQHIAKLAALRIEPEKQEQFCQDMEAIVAMVSKLPDAAGVPVTDGAMMLREDVVRTEAFSRDELLQNAPCVKDGCVAVPRTVG